jgi:membrane fusion protein
MTEQLFRQQVIEENRVRLAGAVVGAVPPSSRLYTGLALAVAAALALLLVLGSWPRTAQVRGVLAYDAGIARVYPSVAAEVREIHVRPGQAVAAGTPLVTLAVAQGAGGLAGQLAQLGARDDELSRQIGLAAELGEVEGRSLRLQRSSLAAAIASLERQRTIAAGQIALAESAVARATQLAAEGAGTQRQVEDSRSALLVRRGEVESLNERLIAQRDALRTTEARLAQRALEADRSRSALAAERAALAEQRADLMRSDRLVLTAPVAGEVGDVGVELGQRARPDRSLVTIVPRGSRLEVWLYAPSRAVGFVRPGQPVRLLFDAFPHQSHGAGRGTVIAVSRVPVDPAAIDAELGLDEPVFRIRVRLNEAAQLPAAARALRPGMTLSANVVLERRGLWQVLINPFRGAAR